eukprot:524397-Amphidinium_carterae.1
MENYYVEMDILQEVLKKYADNYGEIEDTDEYKTARENRDDGKIKELYFKIAEVKRKKEEYRKEVQQEEADRKRAEDEERLKKKRGQEEQESAATAAA